MEERYDVYEDEISIGSLLLYCMKHWKSILLAVVIGLVLGGGYKAVTSGSTSANETVEAEEEAWDEEAQLALDVETAEHLVRYSEQRIESLNTYIKNTKLMALDPYAMYQGSAVYTVNAPEADLTDVMEQLHAYATEGGLFADLAGNAGLYSERDLEYLVNVSGLEKGKLELADSLLVELLTENHVFTVSALGQTETEAQELLAAAQAELETYLDSLKEDFDVRTVDVQKAVILETTASSLADYQARLINALSAEKENLTKRITELESVEAEQETAVTGQETAGVSVKQVVLFAAIGAVVGGICMAGIWVLVYLFGGKLYAVADVERKFRTKALGTVCDTQKYKGIDRWVAQKQGGVYSSLTREEQQEIVLSNVKNELKKNYSEGGSVFLSSSLGKEMAEAAEFLAQGLEAAGYKVKSVRSVLGHADALEELAQCDVAIVIESPCLTRNGLLTEELGVLREYVGNVAGMVMVG